MAKKKQSGTDVFVSNEAIDFYVDAPHGLDAESLETLRTSLQPCQSHKDAVEVIKTHFGRTASES